MERNLFDATEHLIREGASFAEISVERLVAQAGISRSTFYVHFQDKGELARKLASTVLDELGEVADRWWRTAEHADRTALHDAIAAIVAVYRSRAAAFTVVVETATYDPTVAAELQTRAQQIIDAAHAAIERGKAAGVMRDVAPAETAAVLTWMVERAGYQLVRGGDSAHDPAFVHVLADIVWTTLYPPRP
jgi:AcrR family transcriptional regulator